MTMTDDLIDQPPGVELIPADAHGLIVGDTPQGILSNATLIADALKGLIESQGLSVGVGGDRRHVEVGGWQAAGAMLGALGGQALHAETIWSRRMDRDDAVVYESRCEVRTLAGEVVGAAEAMCSSTERNWRKAEEYAIRSMAETRAESRAYRRAIGWVINLAGYSPTPAEETGTSSPETGAGPGGAAGKLPAWAAPVSDVGTVAAALTVLFTTLGVDEPSQATARVGQAIFDECDQGIPVCVASVIERIAAAVHAGAEAPPVDAEAQSEPDPAPEPESIDETQESTT